jgi:hypothetical protein
MTCKLGNHKITCFRGGHPLDGMKGIIKDKQENEWYIKNTGEEFKKLPDMYHVETYNRKGKLHKKYIKIFLTFVRDIEE